jgi:hypothetical protein
VTLPELTVTERAIIDLERQREAHMARAKNYNPATNGLGAEAGDLKLTPDYVEALSRPVRIEMVFDDPMKVREQIEVLMGYLSDAKVVTQQHEIGINRQRLRLRGVIKEAADALTIINGRTPAGRRRKAAQNIQD